MENIANSSSEREAKDVFVVVLGSGLQKRSGAIFPSLDEKARIIAGLEVVKDTGAKNIVFTGADVYKIGRSIADVSSEYAQKKSLRDHITPQVKIDQIPATNTVEEIQKIADLQRGNPTARFVVISNSYHLVAQKMCRRYHLEFISAEEKLKERYGERYAQKIDEIMASKEYRELVKSQTMRSQILDLPQGEAAYKRIDHKTKKNVTLK
jgi:hypothetical protein